MAWFNPLDMDRWRGLIRAFDAKRAAFYAMIAELSQPVQDAKLEAQRRALLARAAPLKAQLEKTMESLASVRDMVRGAGRYVGLGGLGIPPLIIGVGIAAVAYIVGKITDWLRDAEQWKTSRAQIEAGWTPEQVKAVQKSLPKEQPQLFGMDMGALKWVAIVAGIAIAGPYVVREIEKRRA